MKMIAFTFQGFFNFTSRRPRHLLHILELGYNVMYNDVDMVWLADPFPYLEGNHDVYFTDDMAAVCTTFLPPHSAMFVEMDYSQACIWTLIYYLLFFEQERELSYKFGKFKWKMLEDFSFLDEILYICLFLWSIYPFDLNMWYLQISV